MMFGFLYEAAPVYSAPIVFREAIKNFGTCILEGASLFRAVGTASFVLNITCAPHGNFQMC